MAVDQLPGQVREFANYLNSLLARLNQGGGWCAVFWQRDPDGMRACLDGREVPPWDVVEALLQDLAAERGPGAMAPDRELARALHAAALIAYDVRPGGRDALGDRLDVMLREQRYAAERQAELGRLLSSATTRQEADALRLDLAWARDDHERATARCAEIRARMAELDRQLTGGQATVMRRGRLAGAMYRVDGDRTRHGTQAGRLGDEGRAGAAAGDARGGGRGGQDAGFPRQHGSYDPAATGGRQDGYGSGAESTREQLAPHTNAGYAPRPTGTTQPVQPGYASDPSAVQQASPAAQQPAQVFERPGPQQPTPGFERPAWRQPAHAFEPAAAQQPSPAAQQPAQVFERPGPQQPAPAFEGPGPHQPAPGFERPAVRQATPVSERPAWSTEPAPGLEHAVPPDSAPAPEPPGRKQRKRRRGSARFAGMGEEAGAPVAVPPGDMTVLPAPDAAGGRTPRGARFAGVAEVADEGVPEVAVETLDAEAARDVAAAVERLVRLRTEGRSGEAHALLVEAAHWPAARFPLLAAQLQRAGLGADWATLLWEAASLPVERLVGAADALAAAGRGGDGEEILRQGVARPSGEIGQAVLELTGEGRQREVRALLDAYVRVRTPEEVARSAEPEPGILVPLLLEAARGVSDERHWDLVHALRVAGLAV